MTGSQLSAKFAAGGGINPFMGRDLPWLVDSQAKTLGDKALLVWEPPTGERKTWSYAEFAEETRRYAAGLHERGVKAGDVVLIHMDNCPEFLLSWVASSRLGAVAAASNTGSTIDELRYFISHTRAKVVLTQRKFVDLVLQAEPGLQLVGCAESAFDGSEANNPLPPGVVPFAELRSANGEIPRLPADPDRVNNVIFTSGTTAAPKGVEWTHGNVLWIARQSAQSLCLNADDVTLVYLPLFHSQATGLSFLSTLWIGGTAVLLPKFTSSRFWDISLRNRITWCSFVGFTLRAVMSLADPPEHHYRLWVGAHLKTVRDRYGVKSHFGFGMTETLGLCVGTDQSAEEFDLSMGSAAMGYEVQIRDEDGSPTAVGEPGGLWVRGIRGVSLFHGYLNDPEATRASFDEDGWFHTGDQVKVLENGHFFYVGREKDMLKVGGENVAAQEIEGVIARVPGVAEVAVVGRPDPMYDEVPVAFVVSPAAGPQLKQGILDACSAGLSPFKRPRDVVFKDALPKGLLDKVLKRELRLEAAATAEADADASSRSTSAKDTVAPA